MAAITPIPSNANWFYVSDSYTLQLSGSGAPPYAQYFQPGPANQTGVIAANSSCSIYIKSCSLVVLPIAAEPVLQGINADMRVGLYNISGSSALWVSSMPFKSPYGIAEYAVVMNSVSKLSNNAQRAVREFGVDTPLIIGGPTPAGSSAYQVGVGFQFNYGTSNILVQYEYHLHGAWI